MSRRGGGPRALVRGIGAFLLALVVAGCSGGLLRKEIDYKSSSKLPPLEIPPDLTAPSTSDRYTVPDVNAPGPATYSAYSAERAGRPQPSGVSTLLPENAQVRIERAGSERWLVVNQPPEKVWPVVRDFWLELGFIIATEVPEAGVMETDWAENRAKIPQDFIRDTLGKVLDQLWSSGERDKFRTRLEPIKDRTATEVYISHRGMVERLVGNNPNEPQGSVWEPVPPNPDLEAEMLRRLAVRFGVEEERSRQLLAAPSREPQASLMPGAGTLALVDPFDRAWRRVGLALDRVGFTVVDRDRSNGIYYVRYAPLETQPRKEGGLLSRLAFWRSDEGGKPRPEQYRVHLEPTGEGTRVSVLDKEGQPEKSETGKKILSLLYEQLK